MPEIVQLYEVMEITVSNMLRFADRGKMSREGASFFETPNEIMVTFNTNEVPYIIYQNEGFTHWISGDFIDVNQGFVKQGFDKVTRMIYSKFLGMPYNNLEDTQILLERNNLMMVELGAFIDV